MIPRDYITAWRAEAPWVQDIQVEQDLVICRALVEIFANRAQQGGHTLERAAAQSGSCDLGEPPLDEIEPRTAGRCEMQVHARMSSEPAAHRWTLVCARVVDDQMEIQTRRRFPIEPLEKGDELNFRAPLVLVEVNH